MTNENMHGKQATGGTSSAKKSSLVYSANIIGISMIMLVILSVLTKYAGGYLLGILLEKVENTADLVTNLYRIIAGVITLFPPYVFLKKAGKRVKLQIPSGGGKMPLWLILSLFLGTTVCCNAIISLLKSVFSNMTKIEMPESETLPESAIALIIYFIAVCVVPAVFEELLFRGAVQGLLLRWGARFAIGLTTVLFAIMHPGLWSLLNVLVIGFLLSYVRYISGSVTYCIVLHFANNTTAFLIQLVSQRLSGIASFAFSFWMILIFLIFFISSLWILSKRKMWPVFRVEKNWPVPAGKPSRGKRLSSSAFFVAACVVLCLNFIVQIIF